CVHSGPMCATVGIIIELPEMYKLIDHAGIALEVTDKLFVLPARLKRREPDLLIEFHRLSHLADMQRIGSQFVERHGRFLFDWRDRLREYRLSATIPPCCPTFPDLRMVVGSASPYVILGQRQFRKSGAASDSCATRCHATTSAEPNPLFEVKERPEATS